MASYGHLPPPPPQNPIHHHRNNNNNQYNQNWNYGFPESYNHNNQYHPQHHHYPPPPPPPPPESSYIAPPPPPANHYSQHEQQQQQQPPPSRNSPPPPHNEEKGLHDRKSRHVPHRQLKNGDVPPMSAKKSDGRKRKVETEEEIRLRKKREFEKQRQLKKSQNLVLQKTQKKQGRGSVIGSKMVERKIAPLLSSERAENRLKKPTTFVCKLKFRNELPDPTAQPKLMAFKKDKDQYTKYKITSLEKMYKPKLFVEPDLGIPLDLLDLSVYNPPSVRQPLAPEDEELLQDDEAVTPLKNDGRKRKERPTDKGVAWLVKTQYISPLSMESTKQSLTEKQAKELREMKGGRDILENLNDSERQIKEIEASFEVAKSCPVHATNKDLRPIEVLPLLLDFDRYDDQFVVAAFDNSPTADSEMYAKLDKSVRDALESRAIMKSYVSSSTDTANPEKFLAYMVPAPRERSKVYDENGDISYSWVREYHWDVRGDDALGPTTYLVSFDESKARYLPLPTKLILRKKRAKEGRSGDEVEQFQIPSSVVVRRRSSVAAFESKKSRVYTKTKGSSSKPRGGIEIDNDMEEQHRGALHQDNDQSHGAEDDMSD